MTFRNPLTRSIPKESSPAGVLAGGETAALPATAPWTVGTTFAGEDQSLLSLLNIPLLGSLVGGNDDSRSDNGRLIRRSVLAGLLFLLIFGLLLEDHAPDLLETAADGSEEARRDPGDGAIDVENGHTNLASNGAEPRIWEETDKDSHGQGQHGEHDTNGPLDTVDGVGRDAEGLLAHKDDGNLCADHDTVDADEEGVALNAFEDIELIVKTTVVELVEDLHPDKRVEDHSVKLKLLLRVAGVVSEDAGASKVQDQCRRELEDGLADDHLPHVEGDERSRLALRLAIEDLLGRRVGGKSKGSKCVHDEVDPKELHSSKDRLHLGAGKLLGELLLGKGPEHRAFKNQAALGVDAALSSDSLGSYGVISSHHPGRDASTGSLAHSLWDARADRILDTNDAKEDKVLKDSSKIGVAILRLDMRGRPLREVVVDHGDGTERLLSVGGDGSAKVIAVVLSHRADGQRVDVDGRIAVIEQNLRSTLDEKSVTSVARQLNHGTHALLARVERHHLRNSLVGPSLSKGLHTHVVASEVQHCRLRLGSDESGLTIFLALKGGRVDGNGLNNEFLGSSRQRASELDNASALIRLRLGEGGRTKGAGNDSHLVRGQSTRLVGADRCRVAHRLASAKDTDKVLLLEEAGGCEREGEGNSKR
ncbi:hypothetical protein BN1723_012736 [Verticillium longisporum]|uniref:Uncharacterized protein n=1 Tax=Verticillium longisporum TaxID=100787 RepID=A0A0G4LL61_VERLO|nr:hypothetical protein BN1723_012736 [Verticillium longisporum]